MIRATLVDYIYDKYFRDLFPKELGGESFASNTINAILNPAYPMRIGIVHDEAGTPVLSEKQATGICHDLGVDLFIIDVQENLAYLDENEEINKILSSKPVLLAAQQDLKLLLAVAQHFADVELLHQTVEDPINGRLIKSKEAFEYLFKCFIMLP